MKLIEKVRDTASRLRIMGRRQPRKIPPQKLQARVRASVAATADPYDDDEPQTKLTSAFIVVLILHVVAVGGIYAFNQIKASRRTLESTPVVPARQAATSTVASDATEPTQTRTTIAPAAPAAASTLSSPSHPRIYSVKSGDTLNSIAKLNGTSVSELKALNSLTNDSIRSGMILNLPAPGGKPIAETAPVKRSEASDGKLAKPTSYTVKSGDRLIFIAKKYNVSPEELISYNKIADPAKLQIGQNLKIPAKK